MRTGLNGPSRSIRPGLLAKCLLSFTTGERATSETEEEVEPPPAPRTGDLLVYPIVHNYRHHVELTLKHLIALGSYLSERVVNPQILRLLLNEHDLAQLWGTLKPILLAAGAAVGWKPENVDIEGVESYIRQLSVADRGSFSFRYATDKKGHPSLPGMTHLNIYVFANHMEQLAEYLDTIAFGFSIEEDLKQEYEAEMRSY